jgi:Spy/CpxP family protein refolding chaperone
MIRLLAGLAMVFAYVIGAAAPAGPDAGKKGPQIKSLTQEQVAELETGAGMGLARAAELNGYPGPRHVLDLARALSLTDAQARETGRIFAAMQSRAVTLGRMLLDAERELDALFQSRRATRDTVATTMARIGQLQGELRAVHLEAHVEQTAILSREQVARYSQLRGHDSAPGDAGRHHQP